MTAPGRSASLVGFAAGVVQILAGGPEPPARSGAGTAVRDDLTRLL